MEERSGMLSVGDEPFWLVLPEPIISGLRARLFTANSNDHYVPAS